MNTPNYFCLDNFTSLDIITGIEEINAFESSTVIYPNPTASQLNISSENPIVKIEIFNSVGALAYQSTSLINNIAALQKGLYFVRISYAKGNSITKRIIKE